MDQAFRSQIISDYGVAWPGWCHKCEYQGTVTCQCCREYNELGMPELFAYKNLEHKPEPGKKWDRGKLRYDLLPYDVLEQVVQVLTDGAGDYGDRNWERGMSWGRVFAAAQRHQAKFWQGQEIDPDSGHNHLAHAIVNLMFLLRYHSKDMKEFDDRGRDES